MNKKPIFVGRHLFAGELLSGIVCKEQFRQVSGELKKFCEKKKKN